MQIDINLSIHLVLNETKDEFEHLVCTFVATFFATGVQPTAMVTVSAEIAVLNNCILIAVPLCAAEDDAGENPPWKALLGIH